ncbi:MAG: tetratricopeptide repeat protein, partial [Terriglobales bacterium]
MFFLSRSGFVAALLFFSVFMQLDVFGEDLGEDAKAPAISTGLAAADQLYRSGKFAEAEASYQALVKTDPKLVPAEVGLVRAMLRQQKVDEALDAVNAALVAQPDAAALLAAKGDVQFRRAEMSDAELSFLAAKKLDRNEVHA